MKGEVRLKDVNKTFVGTLFKSNPILAQLIFSTEVEVLWDNCGLCFVCNDIRAVNFLHVHKKQVIKYLGDSIPFQKFSIFLGNEIRYCIQYESEKPTDQKKKRKPPKSKKPKPEQTDEPDSDK